jgi:hypothetical protein
MSKGKLKAIPSGLVERMTMIKNAAMLKALAMQ